MGADARARVRACARFSLGGWRGSVHGARGEVCWGEGGGTRRAAGEGGITPSLNARMGLGFEDLMQLFYRVISGG